MKESGKGGTVPDSAAASPRFSVAVLQAENRRLREQLDALMAEARLNQDKLRRFDQLERKVIGASSLSGLVQTLLVDYPALFELDGVTLALVDVQYEAARILGEAGAVPAQLVLLNSEQPLQQLYAAGARPLLGAPTVAHHFLLEGAPGTPASVAFLPLVHRGAYIGSLNLLSRDPARFAAGSSTTNSSPPYRATTSLPRSWARIRRAT